MNYKYKKGQLFGKRLKVPKDILHKVYNETLSFSEFIEYDLEDKIPISCLAFSERAVVEKFGIEKAKQLDWELIKSRNYFTHNARIDFFTLLLNIDPQVDDINGELYRQVIDFIPPINYSERMKEIYKDRFFDLPEESNNELQQLEIRFNEGRVSLKEIIRNWDLFKNKDLGFCLANDIDNVTHITNDDVKSFMSKNSILASIIEQHGKIYSFISTFTSLKDEEEKLSYIKNSTDSLLASVHERAKRRNAPINLTNEQFKELFKYSSLEEYLKLFSVYDAETICKELENLPKDYIFDIPIPFSELLDSDVLSFLRTYGLKNVVDFDTECGNFFTKDDCALLKSVYMMYLHYAGNTHDRRKTIHTKPSSEYDRPYTKEEFYEAMRRMILYGPTDGAYVDKAPDYRSITGEFRDKNPDLFISEQAPAELQQLFYTKSLTPQIIASNPNYIPFLEGKNLDAAFKILDIQHVDEGFTHRYDSIYAFLENKADFSTIMNFISEYSDVLEIVFNGNPNDRSIFDIKFLDSDSLEQIEERIDKFFKRLIIERRLPYPSNIPKHLIASYPSMFLSNGAPLELQEAFYKRKIDSEFILSNLSYTEFLKNIDLEVLFDYIRVSVPYQYYSINLIELIKQAFGQQEGFDLMLLYGKYIEKVFNSDAINGIRLKQFNLNEDFSKDELLDELDRFIFQAIIDGNLRYDKNMPTHFKNNHPTLFLGPNVPKEIYDKLSNREFTLDDFENNPELLEIFENANVVCGFPEEFAWIIPLFSNLDNQKTANYNRLKIIEAYSMIDDFALKDSFKKAIIELHNDIDISKIQYMLDVLVKLSLTNSSEIFSLRKELGVQILKSQNPIESLNMIEAVFVKNNIPIVGKVYSCFEILHPNFEGFNFQNSPISPTLKNASLIGKKILVFSDLIKASFGSDNRSINDYLKNIEIGTNLYKKIKSGQSSLENIGDQEKKELITFSKHLATLYNNTAKARRENSMFFPSGNVLEDILKLSKLLSPNGSLDYDLGDRVIRMFCGFTGIDTLEQAKEYISSKVKNADVRNRAAAQTPMVLSQGDFIKGIGNITYLRNILQNGSVSKEYLGSNIDSDSTPLDTDISMIISSEGRIRDKIESTNANGYGPIFLVLKNNDRFSITRTKDGDLPTKADPEKIEAFYTGALGEDHYGIRTGFASSEIDYIVMEVFDPRVGLEIAMNGFYIPVADKDGNIVFTPQDYDKIRKKMGGLSYFGENEFSFSDNLITEETELLAQQIEQSNKETVLKRDKINEIIRNVIAELGLQLKTSIDGDLTEGFAELIDTGSTGRGTNKPGDGDFDFILRLDKLIISNPNKLAEIKRAILKALGKENTNELTGNGDFRLKKVQIDDNTTVDIDITFAERTSKISYSTDMALQDRMSTIKKNGPEKYKYIVANILLAKQVLKSAEAYKPDRGETPQGGLGGVGIENWILQDGGSFVDAARSFVAAAEGKSFEEFKAVYQIWDFGDNYLSEKRGQYCHDNFVACNMSESGYQKMLQALKEYLKMVDDYHEEIENIKR